MIYIRMYWRTRVELFCIGYSTFMLWSIPHYKKSEKNKNSKLKKWIEFWCVCVIIGCISGFTWSDNMVMNIIVIITSALILAIIRVVLIFYSNSRR